MSTSALSFALTSGLGRALSGPYGAIGEPRIVLSNASIAEDAAAGANVGTLSVVNATGTPVFSLTDTAGNRFAVDGTALERGATALNFEAGTSHNITISVSGMTPAPDDLPVAISVTNINEAPTVANVIPDQTSTEAVPFSFQFNSNTFADVDAGTTLTYSATKSDNSALPAWLTFTAGTRTFSGTPAGGDVGTLSVKVTASDGALTVSDTFDLVISAAAASLPLDAISASGAWSTRKLRTAYAGSCMRVRRSSDNVEADIGFSGNDLDTTALLTHCGAGDGFIVTKYDQSGNARNVTMATAALQPKIVSAGAVITTVNSKPSPAYTFAVGEYLQGAAISNFITASAYTIFSSARPAGGVSAGYNSRIITGDAGGFLWHGAGASDLLSLGHWDSGEKNITKAAVYPVTKLAISRQGSGTLSAWAEGGAASTLSAADVASVSGLIRVGNIGGLDAHILEVLYFNSALSLADINALGAAMATYSGATWVTAT